MNNIININLNYLKALTNQNPKLLKFEFLLLQ